MKKILLILLIAFSSLNAEVVKATYNFIACKNLKIFDDFEEAVEASGNYHSLDYFARRGCTVIPKNTELTVLNDRATDSLIKVMFYDKIRKEKVIMYTYIEAIVGYHITQSDLDELRAM